jgi:hypothetical protein
MSFFIRSRNSRDLGPGGDTFTLIACISGTDVTNVGVYLLENMVVLGLLPTLVNVFTKVSPDFE